MDDFIVECNTEKRKINGNECYLFFNKDICLDKRKNDYIIKMTSIIINHQDAKKINAKTTQRLKSYYSYPLNNAGSEVVF